MDKLLRLKNSSKGIDISMGNGYGELDYRYSEGVDDSLYITSSGAGTLYLTTQVDEAMRFPDNQIDDMTYKVLKNFDILEDLYLIKIPYTREFDGYVGAKSIQFEDMESGYEPNIRTMFISSLESNRHYLKFEFTRDEVLDIYPLLSDFMVSKY